MVFENIIPQQRAERTPGAVAVSGVEGEARMEAKNVGTSGLAKAALVLGIVGLLLSPFLYLSPLSIGAIICGALGMGRTGVGKMRGYRMAVAGLVLGFVGLASCLFFLILLVSLATRL
jgi:hypothetical protein